MVVAASAAVPKNPSVVTRPRDPTPNSSRRPLTPSERDNAGVSRRPRTKEITSRYLSSYSSSSSSTTSTSYASNTTTISSSSSFSSRRFPSPLPAIHRPSTPSTFSQGGGKRSQSVDRPRPSSSCSDPRRGGGAAAAAGMNASRALCTTTRSLSVSFQGESFFYQTSRAKDSSPVPARKPSPDRRRPSTSAKNSNAGMIDNSENSKPRENHRHRWPAAKSRQSKLLTKSLDSSAERNGVLFAAQLLRQSMLSDGSSRTSFDAADFSASSDTDSFSSESNSGIPELSVPQHALSASGGISVPARFRQEEKSRLHRLPETGTPLSSLGMRNSAAPNVAKKSVVNNPFSSRLPSSSLLRGPARPSSPSKPAGSSPGVLAKPSRARGSGTMARSSPSGMIANAPSIISFAAEMRRSRKGENRIEEAHMLRLLHNRHLQWRCVNARTNASLMIQRVSTERSLYNAWIQISEVLDLVAIQKIKLQFLMQHQKLNSILKGQMVHLEEWSLLDREHSSSLSGAIEALKASTLRLPVVNGSRVDLQEVKDAVWSAIVVMETIGASMHSLISKVEGANSLVSEIAKVAAREQALLNQSRNLLSRVAALNVKYCSLRSHLLQLRRRNSRI